MVFAARQLQEKCQEQNIDLYSAMLMRPNKAETVFLVCHCQGHGCAHALGTGYAAQLCDYCINITTISDELVE